MNHMTLQYHSMDMTYPFIIYEYDNLDHRRCSVDFDVPALTKNCFHPVVSHDGWWLELKTIHSTSRLLDKGRLELADRSLLENSTKLKAYERTVNDIYVSNGFRTENGIMVIERSLQRIRLPFKVRLEIISWDLQVLPAADERFSTDVGQTQVDNCISVEMESVDRRRQYSAEGRTTILSPLRDVGGISSRGTSSSSRSTAASSKKRRGV